MNWLQRILQMPQQQNMLQQAAMPQQQATPEAMPVGGQQMPQQVAQTPGLMDRFRNFREGDRGQFLGDMFTGWAMGSTPNQSLGMGAMMANEGRKMRQGTKKQQEQQNQTVEWLQRQGLDPDSAALLASNPTTLQEYLKEMMLPKQEEPTDTMRNLEWRAQQAGLVPGTAEYNDFMVSGGSGQQSGEFRMATPEEAAQYGAAAGQFGPDGRFYPQNPPSGMSIESDGQGGFRMVQGPGAGGGKPLTEQQSKDAVFATRAEGSLPLIDEYGNALTRFDENLGARVPFIGNYMKSEDYQRAEQAGREFLQAILRKDTGAAITKEETQEYGSVYLPQPGDGADVLEQKRISRVRALEAIKAGMPPDAILNQERALRNSGGGASATPNAASGVSEGTIVENDQGQRMILRNGRWEPM